MPNAQGASWDAGPRSCATRPRIEALAGVDVDEERNDMAVDAGPLATYTRPETRVRAAVFSLQLPKASLRA